MFNLTREPSKEKVPHLESVCLPGVSIMLCVVVKQLKLRQNGKFLAVQYLLILLHHPALHNKNSPPWALPPKSLPNLFASFTSNSNLSLNPNVFNNNSLSGSYSFTSCHYTTYYYSSSFQSQACRTSYHINYIHHWESGTTYSHSVGSTFRCDPTTPTSPISISPTITTTFTTFSTSPTS
jgi:hypothetical protein